MKNDKLVDWLVKRINRNQNVLIMITGGTGSGKSYAALKLAQILSTKFKSRFTIKNCAFTMKDFMGRINSGDLERGSVIIFDEFGVGMNSRSSLTIANRIFGFLLQTFRHKNLICIFTSPNFSFVDITARKLFHLWFETFRIDRENKVCHLKPHLARVEQKTGDLKWTFPKLGLNKVLGRYKIGIPSPKLIKNYEDKKEAYTKELNHNILEQLESVDMWGRDKKETEKEVKSEKYKEEIGALAEKIKRHNYGKF